MNSILYSSILKKLSQSVKSWRFIKISDFSSISLQGNRLYTDPIIVVEKDEYDIH